MRTIFALVTKILVFLIFVSIRLISPETSSTASLLPEQRDFGNQITERIFDESYPLSKQSNLTYLYPRIDLSIGYKINQQDRARSDTYRLQQYQQIPNNKVWMHSDPNAQGIKYKSYPINSIMSISNSLSRAMSIRFLDFPECQTINFDEKMSLTKPENRQVLENQLMFSIKPYLSLTDYTKPEGIVIRAISSQSHKKNTRAPYTMGVTNEHKRKFSSIYLRSSIAAQPRKFLFGKVLRQETVFILDDHDSISPLISTSVPRCITETIDESVSNSRHAPELGILIEQDYNLNPNTVIIRESFEERIVPPSGWSEVINNPSYNWKSTTTASYSGWYAADVEYDPDYNPQNEWLITPELKIKKGILSFYSTGSLYWCRELYDNCDLNVWIIVGEIGGSDDILIGKADDDWPATWSWGQSTFNLDSLLPSNPIRIGFQYVGRDGAQVVLDDVTVNDREAVLLGLFLPVILTSP